VKRWQDAASKALSSSGEGRSMDKGSSLMNHESIDRSRGDARLPTACFSSRAKPLVLHGKVTAYQRGLRQLTTAGPRGLDHTLAAPSIRLARYSQLCQFPSQAGQCSVDLGSGHFFGAS